MNLHEAIEQNLFKCLARRLDRAPQSQDLPYTIAVMEEDLRTHGLTDDDAQRVNDAFRRIGPSLQRWPTAATVIVALPRRPAAHRLERKKTAEDWVRAQEKSNELLRVTRTLAASKGATR